jgi:hypothetical protein
MGKQRSRCKPGVDRRPCWSLCDSPAQVSLVRKAHPQLRTFACDQKCKLSGSGGARPARIRTCAQIALPNKSAQSQAPGYRLCLRPNRVPGLRGTTARRALDSPWPVIVQTRVLSLDQYRRGNLPWCCDFLRLGPSPTAAARLRPGPNGVGRWPGCYSPCAGQLNSKEATPFKALPKKKKGASRGRPSQGHKFCQAA